MQRIAESKHCEPGFRDFVCDAVMLNGEASSIPSGSSLDLCNTRPLFLFIVTFPCLIPTWTTLKMETAGSFRTLLPVHQSYTLSLSRRLNGSECTPFVHTVEIRQNVCHIYWNKLTFCNTRLNNLSIRNFEAFVTFTHLSVYLIFLLFSAAVSYLCCQNILNVNKIVWCFICKTHEMLCLLGHPYLLSYMMHF